MLQYIRERKLLKPGDRLAVAVSGGADSVALLRILLDLNKKLGVVLFVAHFNHQLRGEESDADERFVAELARHHDLPYFAGRGDVRAAAAINQRCLEHEARFLRYNWLIDLASDQDLTTIATAHTADDQAETVLMKFLRGAGTRGLAGIHPVLVLDDIPIVRPLLGTTRAEIERYLREIKQPWREDRSNLDTQHTRNRVRHELLPLLERDYNPKLRRLLHGAAEIALGEENFWEANIGPEFLDRVARPHVLRLGGFDQMHVASQRRLLKRFLGWHGLAVDFHHIENLRHCALGEIATANLVGAWQARCEDGQLKLIPARVRASEVKEGYHCLVPLLGSCAIPPSAGLVVKVTIIPGDCAALEPPGSVLSFDRLDTHLTLRNWRPGDRFRPAHSSSEEKLKRLFAEKKIPADQRPLWPVALSKDGRIVWVRGFPVAHDFAWTPGSGDAVRIEVFSAETAVDAT